MGVPGFFVWLMKQYKNKKMVFQKAKADLSDNIHSIDYLLIDMNCMIHPECFKTVDEMKINDIDKMEAKMRNNVITYLERIIEHNMPKKGVYLAVDGVAPVAKMKQQRLRRYKSIKDKELYDSIRKKHNKPSPIYWNNSAITPGTIFMNKLHERITGWAIMYAKKHKIEIIYSSYKEPGEGEHKLLQFIKKNNTIYNYAIYGLDADLIFLALATGLDTIYLMREGKILKVDTLVPGNTLVPAILDSGDTLVPGNINETSDGFNYVSIKIMKECIFDTITKGMKVDLNLDKKSIINDFIFICYLMGNDFLPHLPSLDIYNGAIDILIKKYIGVLEELPGEYIISNNHNMIDINTNMFYMLISKIANEEENILKMKYNKKNYSSSCTSTDPYDIEIHRIENMKFKVVDSIKLGSDNMTEWRKRYYSYYYNIGGDEIDFAQVSYKMDNVSLQKTDIPTHSFCSKMVFHYLKGLKWIALYYFDKCPEWDWYYPYNTSPFLTDIFNYKNDFKKINFILGEPMTPFEQLLTVLPKQSSYLLPQSLQKIMLNCNSSISHLYPSQVELDMVGKKKYWMVEPILPDMEIKLIKQMFEKYSKNLTSSIKILNTLEKSVSYQ